MAINEATRGELLARFMPEDLGLTVDETLGGLALVVLGILALARVDPWLLNSIGTIVAGVALVFMSASLSAELVRAFSTPGRDLVASEIGGGLSASTMAGIVGIILGILGILDIARPTLIAVALIVFGAAVLLDFAVMAQTRAARMTTATTSGESARMAMSVAAGTEMAAIFAGVGLITLGIIAVVGLSSEILVAVALLGLGGYLFLKGTAVVGHMFSWT
jgi:hypothetical protein